MSKLTEQREKTLSYTGGTGKNFRYFCENHSADRIRAGTKSLYAKGSCQSFAGGRSLL